MTLTDNTRTETTPETTAEPTIVAISEPTTETGTKTGTGVGADVGAPAGGELGTLEWVDPNELILGDNVREDDVAPDREFVAHIKRWGLLQPIIARRNGAGVLVVRIGKRRTLGAVKAGLTSVRVLIEPGDPDEQSPAQARGRIIDQLGENEHRQANSAAEKVRAHQQLLDLGLTPTQIAKATAIPAQRAKTITSVARSRLASAVLGRYDLTLDQAAVIAEFDDDTASGNEAVKVLTVAARSQPAQFEHVAQRLRDERRDARLIEARRAELAEAGVRLVEDEQLTEARPLNRLRPSAEDPGGTELTVEAHTQCLGHAAYVRVARPRFDEEPEAVTEYYCTTPDVHAPRWDMATPTTAAAPVHDGRSGAMSEEQKAERRLVIANNKAADSATKVRRKWVKAFLSRKNMPKDALAFIAEHLADGSHAMRRAMESGHTTACELLGLGKGTSYYSGLPHPIAQAAPGAAGPKATRLLLAMVLGAFEEAMRRDEWRHPNRDSRAYLNALAGWGYPLSDIEQQTATEKEPVRGGDDAENTLDTEPTEEAAEKTATEEATEEAIAGQAPGDGAEAGTEGADGDPERDGEPENAFADSGEGGDPPRA